MTQLIKIPSSELQRTIQGKLNHKEQIGAQAKKLRKVRLILRGTVIFKRSKGLATRVNPKILNSLQDSKSLKLL